MFRDGQYLEVIKASNNRLATAVVTVEERIIKIKEKKVSTNKWLDLEDWAELYKILENAILYNVPTDGSLQDFKKCKWKKSTRQLDVTYMFESSQNSAKDVTLLPTIRVNVSPTKRKSKKSETPKSTLKKIKISSGTVDKFSLHMCQKDKSDTSFKKETDTNLTTKICIDTKNDTSKRYLSHECLENNMLEEYIPDVPLTRKVCTNLNYIPSRKSMLKKIQTTSNEYSPMLSDSKGVVGMVQYVPNSMGSSKIFYETYEPSTITVVDDSKEYIPNSKGINTPIEEYHPDFTTKLMKFDNSYVPSSVKIVNETAVKLSQRPKNLDSERHTIRQKETSTKRNLDSLI